MQQRAARLYFQRARDMSTAPAVVFQQDYPFVLGLISEHDRSALQKVTWPLHHTGGSCQISSFNIAPAQGKFLKPGR